MCTMCFVVLTDRDCGFSNPSVTVAATVLESGDAPDTVPAVPSVSMAVGDEFIGTLDLGDRDLVAVSLVAGEFYSIELTGSGTAPVEDTFLRVLDAAGNQVAFNDDANGLYSSLAFSPTVGGTYYLSAGSFRDGGSGGYRLAIERIPVPEAASLDTLANYLTDGYWASVGSVPRAFDVSFNNVITYSLTGLTAAGQQLALWAMEAWEMVADLEFRAASGARADITFDDAQQGAFANTSLSGGRILSSQINVGTDWLAAYGTGYGSYSFQTYVHEIGHAIGLGHQGGYNAVARYPSDADFSNDSWSASVMSYFDQDTNSLDPGSFAHLLTTMPADILAIQSLYGAAQGGATAGNTVWGEGTTLTNYLGGFFADIFEGGAGMAELAFTVFDEGGRDTIRMTQDRTDQVVTLVQEGRSSVMGGTGNLFIARGTVIESFQAGTGDDRVTGNAASNLLAGNAGRDTLAGGNGDDTLDGGDGDDSLQGGAGNDRLIGLVGADGLEGGGGRDVLIGGGGADVLTGGLGNDRLVGNGGADVFVFAAGRDVVADFQNDTDTLHIDAGLLAPGAGWAALQALAASLTDRVVFDFGGGDVLTVFGVSAVEALRDDVLLV